MVQTMVKCNKCPVIAECRALNMTVEKPGNPNVQGSPPTKVKVCPILWVVHTRLNELKPGNGEKP